MGVTRRSFVRAGSSMAALGYAGRLFAAAEKPSAAGVATGEGHIQQVIDGFGFSEAFHMARVIQGLAPEDQTRICGLLFSPNGMGYSILRNQIGSGPAGSGVNDGTVASIEPAANEFNWAGDEDQIWLMNQAKKFGCNRFISSSWSPPAWMKTNNNLYDGELKPANYQAYADYLATYALEYKKRYDLDIYAISPQNEPSFIPKEHYASANWSSSQMTKFLHQNLIPTFAAKGVTAKIFVDEHNNWSDSGINDILSDSVCAKNIEIVAAHAYADDKAQYMDIATRTGRFQNAMDQKKRIWQTEVSAGGEGNIANMNDGVYWARVIHQHMIEDNVSAWLYWWGVSNRDNRGSLISVDKDNKFHLSKRLFTIGQFSRFIRPGYHRVDANPTPAPHTFFSAYMDPTGKQVVCVAINDDAVEHPLTIEGVKGTTCTPFCTSNTETHTKLPPISPTNGNFEVTTTPLSVTTFVIT